MVWVQGHLGYDPFGFPNAGARSRRGRGREKEEGSRDRYRKQ